ncbi:MAG: cation diffusion facilitator family transporter [Candidatus Omnitrophota bacterium]
MGSVMKTSHEHRPKNKSSSEELFEYRSVEKTRLFWAILVTGLVMVVEIVGGFFSHSLALLSDAGHMFTHFLALGISLGAIIVASKPACHHRTFGFFRVEILAALFNGLFLLAVTGWIVYESVLRLFHPAPVLGLQMMVIAIIGLVANVVSAALLHGANKNDLNVKSAFLHMAADTVSSVVVIIGAIVIYYTGWNIIDPLLGVGIALVILHWGWGLLQDSLNILLEGTPKGLTTDMVEQALLEEVPEVGEVWDLHVWAITSEMNFMTVQIRLKKELGAKELKEVRGKIKRLVDERFDIEHATVEFE